MFLKKLEQLLVKQPVYLSSTLLLGETWLAKLCKFIHKCSAVQIILLSRQNERH